MLLALMLATLAPARAEVPVSMTIGGFGLVDTAGGGWIGEYVYFGPSVLFPLTESGNLSLLPQLTIEVSPEWGNWGFVFTPTLEWTPSSKLGIDLVPSVIQDTKGGTTSVILAAGPGATYIFESGLTASFAVQAAYVVNGGVPVTLNPMVQLAVPFP